MVKYEAILNSSLSIVILMYYQAAEETAQDMDVEDDATLYLHIDNFKRPLRLPDLKLYLTSFGPYDLNQFWISPIKTHCFVK
eukprot:Awhi_evm1s8868